MSGLTRFLVVLRLFDEAKNNWTVPEIADVTGIPSSTVYRTARELLAANFLEPAQEGHYRLGSAFIEFDRLIRMTDPLVHLGTHCWEMSLLKRVYPVSRCSADSTVTPSCVLPTKRLLASPSAQAMNVDDLALLPVAPRQR